MSRSIINLSLFALGHEAIIILYATKHQFGAGKIIKYLI